MERPVRGLRPGSNALMVAVTTFILGAAGLIQRQSLAIGLIAVAAALTGYLNLPNVPIPARWWLLAGAAAVACALLVLSVTLLSRAWSPPAQLQVFQLGVHVARSDHAPSASARREQPVKRGWLVRTDATGLAELAYKGMVTRLDKQTTVGLVRLSGLKGYRRFSVRLDAGTVWVTAANAASSDLRYELRTAHTVADVHGTMTAQCASGACSFTSVEGATTLFTADGNRAVTLNSGQFLAVGADGTLGAATLLSPDQLAASDWVRFNRRLNPAQPDMQDLAQATIAGKWHVRQTITKTTGPSGRYPGDTRLHVYEIALDCGQNPCDVRFEGTKLDYDGATYRATLPPDSQPCAGRPGQSQQSFTLKPAKAASQDGVFHATALTGTLVIRFTPGPGSCKPWAYTSELAGPPGGSLPVGYPNDAEEELLNHLGFPERTCQREPQLPRGITAGVTCHPPTGVDSVSIFKFGSRAAMSGHYHNQVRASGVRRDSGFCDQPPDVGTGEGSYTVDDRPAGRLLCYKDGVGRRWIWSTIDRDAIDFVLVRNDGNWPRLYAFWKDDIPN